MRAYKVKKCFLRLMLLITFLLIVMKVQAKNSAKYFMIVSKSKDSNIQVELGQEQTLYDNKSDSISLENLEIISIDIGFHHSFDAEDSDIDTLTAELREYLLLTGYAKLEDSKIATKSEKKAQEYAKKNKLGIWDSEYENKAAVKNEKSSDEKYKIFSKQWWKKTREFLKENIVQIIELLAGLGFFTLVIRMVIRSLRTRKRIIFWGGANSAGKTTMVLAIRNPEASMEDLLTQSPTLDKRRERVIRDDSNKKIILKMDLLDSPGHELQNSIDTLAFTFADRILGRKYILILVVAATKNNKIRNDIDKDYIKEQLITISIFWTALLKAHKIIKPKCVVLFISKCDLYDSREEMEALFDEHKKVLEKACEESMITFCSIPGSVVDKSGMTGLMDVFREKR